MAMAWITNYLQSSIVTIWIQTPEIQTFDFSDTFCPVFKWSDHVMSRNIWIKGILDHKTDIFVRFSDHHSKSGQFDNRTRSDSLNTKLALYSDGYCIWMVLLFVGPLFRSSMEILPGDCRRKVPAVFDWDTIGTRVWVVLEGRITK